MPIDDQWIKVLCTFVGRLTTSSELFNFLLSQYLCTILLGLRSAGRTKVATCLASWVDALPMTQARHSTVADLMVLYLEGKWNRGREVCEPPTEQPSCTGGTLQQKGTGVCADKTSVAVELTVFLAPCACCIFPSRLVFTGEAAKSICLLQRSMFKCRTAWATWVCN